MKKKDYDFDDVLFILEQELKCHKSVKVIYQERLLHEEYLITDIEKKITEYRERKEDIKNSMIE